MALVNTSVFGNVFKSANTLRICLVNYNTNTASNTLYLAMCTNTFKYTQIHSTTFLSEDAVCKVAHCARVSDAYLKKVDKNAKKRKYLTNTDRYAQIRVNTARNTFGKK